MLKILYFRSAIAVIFVLSASVAVLAQTAKPSTNAIDQYLYEQMKVRHIPGMQVAIVRHGEVVFDGAYGVADLQNAVPVTKNTVFPIFSITKAFTGVAAMQLVEAGKLDLAAPVSRYLDGLPPAWQDVTVRQLLTHTSGLPNILDNETGALIAHDEQESWSRVTAMPVEFAPGEKFSYCQTNYLLIGRIIDKLSGEPFTQFITERQLKAAEMLHTEYGDGHAVLLHGARDYSLASGFKQDSQPLARYQNLLIEFSPGLRTAAGMNSTAEDMAHWIIALQAGRLFQDKATLDVLWTPGLLNNGSTQGFSSLFNGYALGWPVLIRPKHRAVAPVGGGHAAVFVYPDDDMTVVIMSNLKRANPEEFVDEVAGFFIPEMKASNGFGLPPAIAKLRSQLLTQGFSHASQVAREIRMQNSRLEFREDDLNSWAYQLLVQKQLDHAVAIFKLTVELYPQSANAYDSLAEGYEDRGDKTLAIANYERSLELNPKNTNAVQHLAKLRGSR